MNYQQSGKKRTSIENRLIMSREMNKWQLQSENKTTFSSHKELHSHLISLPLAPQLLSLKAWVRLSNLCLPFSKDNGYDYIEWSFLDESVDLVLTDPTYNVRKESESSGAVYDKLITDDMAVMVMHFRQLMKSASDGHVFCFKDHFSKWIQVTQDALYGRPGVQKRDQWQSRRA